MTNVMKKNIPILIIILILGSYLGIKALNENGWDGWGFGSAQTLMSSEYWAKDGFAKNYFLFLPSPYSKLIKYLDEPEFRNRAIDDFGGALKRNRIYYTHYPPLYLAPYAFLTKIGFENRSIFRIFSLLISLAGLLFFYLFIKYISNKTVAAIASIYYGFSVTFLNYADAASIQPLTIFFTFLILALSVSRMRRYNALIWIAYLMLSLSSYDATFFVFTWLVLYDAIILKKFLWQKWLFWASAPILGFALQILQNSWYLGWTNAMSDIYVSYIGRAIGSLRGFVLGLISPFVSMTSIKTVFIFKKTVVTLASAAAIVVTLRVISHRERNFWQKISADSNYFRNVIVLAIATIVQPFFINVTGHWPYQGVLTAPFWGLLMGASSVFIINTIKKKEFGTYKKFYFWILTATALVLWSTQFYSTFIYAKDWPNNKPDQKVIEFSKTIEALKSEDENIAFRILPQNPIWKNSFPTFNVAYFIGILTIDFANSRDLLADFWWLRKTSQYPHHSFVISENKIEIENIRDEIKKTLPSRVSEIRDIQGQYLFTISPN